MKISTDIKLKYQDVNKYQIVKNYLILLRTNIKRYQTEISTYQQISRYECIKSKYRNINGYNIKILRCQHVSNKDMMISTGIKIRYEYINMYQIRIWRYHINYYMLMSITLYCWTSATILGVNMPIMPCKKKNCFVFVCYYSCTNDEWKDTKI